MRYLLALTGLLISLNGFSQDFEWAEKLGGFSSVERLFESAVGPDNDFYVGGSFQGSFDLIPGPDQDLLVANGIYDALIAKYDEDGNLVWAKNWGGEQLDEVESINVDVDGNVLVTGYCQGEFDADPGEGVQMVTTDGGYDIFIAKFDPNGELMWFKTLGGDENDVGKSISSDAEGNVFCAGYYEESVTVVIPGSSVETLNAAGSRDIFIVKLTPDGDYLWAQDYGSNSIEEANSIHCDGLGNFYITGFYVSAIDFYPTNDSTVVAPNALFFDAFIAKYTVDNEFVWLKTVGGDNETRGSELTTDAEGNVITVGFFTEVGDFDPGSDSFELTSTGQTDAFISKLDQNGDFIWAKNLGNETFTRGTDVDVDPNNNVYLTGNFTGTMDMDPGESEAIVTSSVTDGFFVKLNASGEYQYAYHNGRLMDGVAIGADGDIFIAGINDDLQDFDPGKGVTELHSINSFPDIFVAKFSQCLTTNLIDDQVSCGPFTWIDGVTYQEDNNTATFVEEENGCETITTLNLEIIELDASISTEGGMLTSNAVDVSYQWLDCDDNFAEIEGETSATFTPTESGNYAIEVSQDNCSETSDCINFIVSSISENNEGQNGFLLYPNPTQGAVTIASQHGIDRVRITNAIGQTVTEEVNVNESNFLIELPDAAGVYFLMIELDGVRQTTKVVKH